MKHTSTDNDVLVRTFGNMAGGAEPAGKTATATAHCVACRPVITATHVLTAGAKPRRRTVCTCKQTRIHDVICFWMIQYT